MKRSLYTWILMGTMVLGGAPIGPAFADGVIQNPTALNKYLQDVQAGADGGLKGCAVGAGGLLVLGLAAVEESLHGPPKLDAAAVKDILALGCGIGGVVGIVGGLAGLKTADANPAVTDRALPSAQAQRVPATQSPTACAEGAEMLE